MRVSEYARMGLHVAELDRIVLTAQERSTLRRAADLLDRIRELRNSRVPTDWYAGEEDDCDLAFGWRICDDLAGRGSISAELVR